ncbi:hypothetical protein CC78DRAFT_581348 [Lojkania enalia]|uniref:Uncharacterized protein n=1 Tax=Lojkania enalia TaxID=147567 RepID=A0A9P4K8E9_9PLEO|nr:hypothetical protein CC78DRAFT_581348 [Didymosphaeria enalia]
MDLATMIDMGYAAARVGCGCAKNIYKEKKSSKLKRLLHGDKAKNESNEKLKEKDDVHDDGLRSVEVEKTAKDTATDGKNNGSPEVKRERAETTQRRCARFYRMNRSITILLFVLEQLQQCPFIPKPLDWLKGYVVSPRKIPYSGERAVLEWRSAQG